MGSPRDHKASTWTAIALASALASGCAMELPDEGLIISHRILAIRTAVTNPLLPEDPELADRPKAEALPFETVTIEPFIVDPDGPVPNDGDDALDLVWIACELTPGQGLFACIQDAMPLTLDDLPDCPVQDPLDLIEGGDSLPETVSPCLIAREPAPEYTVPFSASVFVSGSIELTMIGGVPGGTDTDACARELLSGAYDLPDDCLYAVQRLNVGPLEQLALLADMFGAEIPGLEVPDPDEVPEADRHPRISEVRVGIVSSDGRQIGQAQVIAAGDTVEVPLDRTLQIEVDSPEEDLQTYLIPVNNGESFEERDEAYAGEWFRTWGTLLSSTSDDPESFNQWRLSPGSQDELERPEDDLARLYYVVRDDRQGVNWFWFNLQVTDPVE